MAGLVVSHQGKEVASFLALPIKPSILTFRDSLSICHMGSCLPGRSVMGSCLWELRGAPAPLTLSLQRLWLGFEVGCCCAFVTTGRAKAYLMLLLDFTFRLIAP